MENKISEVVRSLPPGFRFDPTDEELLIQFMKPKIQGQPGKPYYDKITEIDAYDLEPGQWPVMFRHMFNSKELFFFCRLRYKYFSCECYDRTTRGGYWKVTSKDIPIMSEDTTAKIGIKKTLVFYKGHVPNRESSNWVCHEYHLNEKRPYVVCRIKKKKETKPITAHAPTISPEGCSSRPHACASNVSGNPVNQEGDHSSFCNALHNEVAGNQEAVNAQPGSAEEPMALSPFRRLDEPLPYDNVLTYHQPRAEAEYGSSSYLNFPYDRPILSPYSNPAIYPGLAWDDTPEHFPAPTCDDG